MDKAKFGDEFKRYAVVQITERDYPIAEVSKCLGISQHSLYAWKRNFVKSSGTGDDDQAAEILGLKCELVRMTEERDTLKKPPRISPRMQSEISGLRILFLFAPGWRLVHAGPLNNGRFPASAADGGVAQKAGQQGTDTLGPRLPVHQHGLGLIPNAPKSGTLDEPSRKLSRQRRGGKLLQPAQAGTDTALALQNPRRGAAGCVRLHRDVLQPEAHACEKWGAVARRIRTAAGNENRGRLENSRLFNQPRFEYRYVSNE